MVRTASPLGGWGELLIGESRAIEEVRRLVASVARTTASVLLTGPSGCGKELVARAVHRHSDRAGQSFVALNMGAIPRDLVESELFGHEKGAFTGAANPLIGRFEEASGGTLFLDEIGDMPAEMQVKLLRVLEDRAVTRVGGRTRTAVDTRIVAATHRDLDSEIARGNFREDLFYRLAIFPIAIPSLAERAQDIPLLIAHFLQGHGDGGGTSFSPRAIQRLIDYRWPGNVRELRNVIERAVILHRGELICVEAVDALLSLRPRQQNDERDSLWSASALPLPEAPVAAAPHGNIVLPVDLRRVVADLEHAHIVHALRHSRGVVADAARMLSLQRTTLIEKMSKYGISKVQP
jgi:sigma-54 dependent transcriptional regulator, flagellar regulatory protein